jgi:hypothetical protein
MMTAAQLPVEFLLPETGASEDMPGLFGPPGLPTQPTAIATSSIPPAPLSPPPLPSPIPPPVASPQAPVPVRPISPSAPTPPLKAAVSVAPVVPVVQHAITPTPFPPAPPLPTAIKPAIPTYPATPQADVKLAEVQAVTQAQLPYTMSGTTVPTPPLQVPVATSSGGTVIKVDKEMPTWLSILIKLCVSCFIFAAVGFGLFGGYTFIQNNPELLAQLPLEQLTMTFGSAGWLLPGLLLGVGMIFIVFGYFIQKSSE